MKYVLLFLLMIGFVSAVGVDFDCPEEVFVDEEFECELEVFDGDDCYDVKIELDQERNSILEVWNGEKWISGYYYLKEFIEDGTEENVLLRVSETGDYDGFLKLRQGGKREFFEIEIDVSLRDDSGEPEESDDSGEPEEGDGMLYNELADEDVGEDVEVLTEKKEGMVFLNGDVVEEQEFVYISRDKKVADSLIYFFSLFLIFIIGFLLWENVR